MEEMAGVSKEGSEGGRKTWTYLVVIEEPFVVDLGERLHVCRCDGKAVRTSIT
jgi:hypothetical protein